ncbi:putative Diguanylate cyclase [Candidatus Terasakiella magnetica]|uniref:Putative Diguanylate cyclase n=1 Tax=Candidatus Terasakiella magnetica TaxID=1867952 RepID=A0A1C3RKE2_9PROT|nr:EAL domain-containing protein [Candidatus Terasakiella magnetica]SCA57713.1 putative Diguanylate cyclase [Candidatus Terasakiella magnetica]
MMVSTPSALGLSKKSVYVRAFLVFVVGLCLSISASYFVLQFQDEQNKKRLLQDANEYVHALSRELDRKANILSPLSGQFHLEKKKPTREDVTKALQELSPLLGGLSYDDGFSYLAWAPTWLGRSKATFKDIVALEDWQQERTGRFIMSHLQKWHFNTTRPVQKEGAVFGFDHNEKRGEFYLVIGQPFFQQFQLLGSSNEAQQFPQGYLLGWLDIAKLIRKSWDGLRNPNNLISLKITKSPQLDEYLLYHSGLVESQTLEKIQKIFSTAQSHSFTLAGMHMELSLLPLNKKQIGFYQDLHWITLALGVASTLIWCLMVALMGHHKHTSEYSRNSLEDYGRKLADETHQRQVVEDVLRMNEARWHYVVDNLPIALFAVDYDGMFTLGEGRGLEALGLKAAQVEGNSIFDVFKDYPLIINICRECLGGEERRETFLINHHWVDMRFTPVIQPNGGFDGMICVASDVTEEYRVQERLDKANLHLQGLMDNLPTGVAFVRSGVIQWCSQRLEEMFGYEPGKLAGRAPEILYNEVESYRDIENRARAKLLNNELVEFNTVFRRNEGGRFYGDLIGRAVDEKNYHAGTMWVIQDLTKILEEEKYRRLSKTVFDNVTEGVMVTNGATEITFTNNAFKSITGYSDHETLGKKPSFLSSGKHDRSFYQKMWTTINEIGTWSGEIWNRRKNGETYLEWLTITALQDDEGAIEEYVAVFSDITKYRQSQEELRYQASYDKLTGLPNRQLLEDRFHQACAQATREDKPFAFVYLDVDNFKFFNESLGHDYGDMILKEIAQRLDGAMRSVDTIARIGSDEFILLLVGTGEEDTVSRAVTHLLSRVKEPFKLPELPEEITISASCGIAIYPDDATEYSELIRKADAALYHAKETERGIFMFFTEDMNVRVKERLMLENKLRRAIEAEEFTLYYQPKVIAETGEITGAEALIRWVDPELGIIGPDKFIPVAEETGLIVPIGEWVFRTACAQMKKWKDMGLSITNVAVNLSGRQFSKPDLAADLMAIMEEEQADPKMLEIEITESFIASSQSSMVESLAVLSKKGVKLSVDDFGTGYSSLSYLHRFPLDIMKIDRSFIMNIKEGEDDTSEKLAKAVIAIGKSMNLKIVGEGVENDTQLEFLRENGCDYIQGYYFSKPVPADEFEKLLQEGATL